MDKTFDGSEIDPLSFCGKTVRFNHLPDSEPIRVLRVTIDGMLEIEGLAGQFGPSWFTKVGEWRD
jgi:hypothetical protein